MNYLISMFSILHRQSEIFLSRRLCPLGLSTNQFIYIMCLCEHPGISQEQLSEIVRIDKGSVARSLRQLCELGYLTRIISETDKRQYSLLPTEKAAGVYPTLHEIVMEYESYLTRNLTPEQSDQLYSLLSSLEEDI